MRPWAIHVPLIDDELFSTWLARVAIAQGCDPIDLTGSLWPSWRAWTVDIDRGLRDDRKRLLAIRSGVSEERIEEAMLLRVLKCIAPEAQPSQATWPWILALGSRNRLRRGGLQFCSTCLAEDAAPYFRRTWRLAWHVGCARHNALLGDHCEQCKSPAEPHRARATDRLLCRCPNCGFDLRRTKTFKVDTDALAFQATADDVLVRGGGTWEGEAVEPGAWFALAAKHAKGPVIEIPGLNSVRGITSLALSLQRPSERALRLSKAYRRMNGDCMKTEHLIPCGGDKKSASSTSPSFDSGDKSRPAKGRPKAKVQGEWVRLLRRLRLGHL